jgi:hypothetical protein
MVWHSQNGDLKKRRFHKEASFKLNSWIYGAILAKAASITAATSA